MVKTEEWGNEGGYPWRIVLYGIVIIAFLIGSVVAVYNITSPPSDPVTVSEPAELSKPAVNATTAVTGNTIQITTVLSDSAEGLQVFFYENDANIGSAYTDSTGTAIFNRVVATVGTYIYTAECLHP